jgi:beta-N-acetylhexosaminidase
VVLQAPRFGVFFLLILSSAVPALSLDFQGSGDPQALAQSLVAAMSDEQALAQTFMLGWGGAAPSPLIVDWIRDRNIGGVKIFGWNTGDTLKLAEAVGLLQRTALEGAFGIPLLVATDQEGGWIRHVKGATSESPGNMAIGASGYPLDAYRAGYYIGRELALLGINMNFAPTVDLYTNRDSSLIGPRAFGIDPVQAGILGAAFVKGQKAAGLIATAKHYPGHGDTDLDSHGVLPRIGLDFEELWERELVPYRMLVREGIQAIMSGHLAFPLTRAGPDPASLSSWFLEEVLRERIGFQGIMITDDLLMNGAAVYAGSLSQAAKRALLAGNDLILLSTTPELLDPVWTSLLAAMKGEPRFQSRVRDAARRVLVLKLERLRGPGAVPLFPDREQVRESLPDPEAQAFFLDLAARSVTLVKGGGKTIPLSPGEAGTVVLGGRYEGFFKAGRMAYPGALVCRTGSPSEDAEFLSAAGRAGTVIFCLAESSEVPLLQKLRGRGPRVIVLSILSPVHLEKVLWADGALAVYSYAPESFIAGFSALRGLIPAPGTLPFPLGGDPVLGERAGP